MELQLRSIKSL